MPTPSLRPLRPDRALAGGVLLALGAGGLAACGTSAAAGGDAVTVVVGAYPVQFVAERVGGDAVDVVNLTPPGAEPHDLELAPRDVGQVVDADLVLLVPGLQPALDETAAERDPATVVDVTEGVDLLPATEESHEGETEEEHEAHENDADDPHFWLDPTRLADAADALATRLGETAPDEAGGFTERAAALRAELEDLDVEYSDALARCTSRELVTAHTAFGYLADRYDLHQVGITGLSPEQEATPGQLTAVTELVREHQVTTIFTETLVDPAVAEVVAAETGATTSVLDPLEGLGDDSAGEDYLEVMAANLENLRTGLGCA